MAVVLDAGALIAVDRGDRSVNALLRVAQQARLPVRTSAGVIAQVWRHGARQVHLARVLTGIAVVPLDGQAARQVGELLGDTKTAELADAHLGLVVRSGDTVITGDADDVSGILAARGVNATVHRI